MKEEKAPYRRMTRSQKNQEEPPKSTVAFSEPTLQETEPFEVVIETGQN